MKRYISANDINKFTYCPYQWYYEQVYGTAALREIRREALKESGLSDGTESLMSKGLRFHEQAIPRRTNLAKIIIVILAVASAAVYLYLRFFS